MRHGVPAPRGSAEKPGDRRSRAMAPELLCLRGMSTTRLASLLSLLAGGLMTASLVGCSAAVAPAMADAGYDDDGCGGPMDGGDGGKRDADGGPGCVTPTPIAADTVFDTACLADMEATCKSALTACERDCSCSAFAYECLNTSVELGVVECLSAAQGPVETQLFDCIYFSGPCNDAKAGHGVDAGTGD